MGITDEQRYQLVTDRAWDLKQAIASLSGDAKARKVMAPVFAWIEANLRATTTPKEGE